MNIYETSLHVYILIELLSFKIYSNLQKSDKYTSSNFTEEQKKNTFMLHRYFLSDGYFLGHDVSTVSSAWCILYTFLTLEKLNF